MKLVIFDEDPGTVKLEDCDPSRIYVFKARSSNLFKLQRYHTGESYCWGWCSLVSSLDSFWNTNYSSFKKALEHVKSEGTVHEFATLKDFSNWLQEEAKCL